MTTIFCLRAFIILATFTKASFACIWASRTFHIRSAMAIVWYTSIRTSNAVLIGVAFYNWSKLTNYLDLKYTISKLYVSRIYFSHNVFFFCYLRRARTGRRVSRSDNRHSKHTLKLQLRCLETSMGGFWYHNFIIKSLLSKYIILPRCL